MTMRRALCVLASLLLFSAVVPPGMAGAWPPTYAVDAYEASGGDDIKASARIITAQVAAAGHDPYTEAHTIDIANATTGDQDWYRFTVSSHDAVAGIVYVIEAVSNDSRDVNPVIEIYGPGLAFTPTDPLSLNPYTTDPVAIASNIRGPWWDHLGASVTFRPVAGGDYFIRIRPYGDNSGSGYFDNAGRYTFRIKVGTLTRIAGSNRIATAVQASVERFADISLRGSMGYFNLSSAIVANGYNFPDALAGGSLAGICQGPILLTESGALPAATKAELQRLDPDTVYVLGGTAAVSEAVVQQIEDAFPSWAPVTVVRVEGSDRVATSVEIAKTMSGLVSTPDPPWPGQSPPGFAFICNAYNYPDSLSASSMSAARFAPILLTGASSLDPRVLQCIRDLAITDVAIVGGTSVVSATVESQLKAELGANRVIRLAGSNRYHTSKVFATWAAGLPANTAQVGTPGRPNALGRSDRERIAVCRGDDFPDALSAAPLCAETWNAAPKPILLTASTTTSKWLYDVDNELPAGARCYLEEVWAVTGVPRIERSYILGGSAAVSDWVFWQLDVQS